MQEIKFTVYGQSVSQGRPRFSKRGKRSIARDPEKSRVFKALVREIAKLRRPEKPFEGPVNLAVKIFRRVPSSWSQKRRLMALEHKIRPVTKPDLSNYIKLIEDAINKVIIKDDSQVVTLDGSGKWYAEMPRAEITITVL